MVLIAEWRPYEYPFRNAMAIVNEIVLFYVFTSIAVMARADITTNTWVDLSKPLAQIFSYFLFL